MLKMANNKESKCENLDPIDLMRVLKIPEEYLANIHVCFLKEKESDCIFRMDLRSPDSLNEFMRKWSEYSHATWRHKKSDPCNMSAGNKNLFWCMYRCQSSDTRITSATSQPSKKHTHCKAEFTVTIRKIPKRCRSKDPHLPCYPTIIKGSFAHNHVLFCADNLKFKDVSSSVIEVFVKYFENGDSPTTALEKHKFELQAKYNDDYFIAAADRSLCPDLPWCQRLYSSIKSKMYNIDDDIEHQLRNKYNSDLFHFAKKSEHFVISICTPLMRRVHSLWPYSGELVFMDSSGNFDCQQHRIFLLLTHSYAGALPLGVIISTSENQDIISEGLRNLVSLTHDIAFHGRKHLGPRIIITDDSRSEQNAIATVFPDTMHLLCTFHILQAVWRYIWKAESGVKMVDRPQLFYYIRRVMYAKTEDELNSNFHSAVSSEVFCSNPKILAYFKDLWLRRLQWALCFRVELLVRGNNTNNYVESTMRILKDKIFHRKKAFNIIHLLDFIFDDLENYYIRKLTDVAIGKNECTVQDRYLHKNCDAMEVLQTGEHMFEVTNTSSNSTYMVDVALGLCSCYVGFNGAPCKHQSAVINKFKVESYNFLPEGDNSQRVLIHRIASGNDANIPDNFYKSMVSATQEEHEALPKNDIEVKQSNNEDEVGILPPIPLKSVEKQNGDEDVIVTAAAEFDSFHRYIHSQLEANSDFLPAIKAFNNAFKKCKTETAVLHALHTFGKTVGKKTSKTISVQPTSRARRVRKLGGSHALQSGRPRKRKLVDHNYFKKKIISVPKLLTHWVNVLLEIPL